MGSLDDRDHETRPFDTQPPQLSGDNRKSMDFDHSPQSTLPFMETLPFNDGIETQVMNFEGETQVSFENGFETEVMNFEGETQVQFGDVCETQVMDFGGGTRVPFEGGFETQVMNFEGEARVSFEDAFETQVMNFAGETQVQFENEFETQVMNFADQTQVLDDYYGFENMDTLLLDDWNIEETDKIDGVESDITDILCDADDLSDNDFVKRGMCSSTDCENATLSQQDDIATRAELDASCDKQTSADDLCDNDFVKRGTCSSTDCEIATLSQQDDIATRAEFDASCDKQTSADVKMNFTSVRVAALRASSLAARSKFLNKSDIELCSAKPNNKSPEEEHNFENSGNTGIEEDDLKDEQIIGTRDESKGNIGNSTVKQLFMNDDKHAENEGMINKSPEEEHSFENSGNTGIEEDDLKDEQIIGTRDESKGNIGNSTVKQLFMNDDDKHAENEGLNNNYAKEVDDDEVVGLSYVNSQEPGDLSQVNALESVDKFLKTNESDFVKPFDTTGSIEKKSKPVSCIKGTKSVAKNIGLKSIAGKTGIYDWDDNCEDESGGEFLSRKKKLLTEDKRNSLTQSFSASKLRSSKRTVKKAKVAEVKKNPAKELDEQLNVDSTDHESRDTSEISKHTCNGSLICRKEDKQFSKKYSLRKRLNSSSSEDRTRNSKKQKIGGTNSNKKLTVSYTKQSNGAREQHREFDAYNFISPSSVQEKVYSYVPIASRTRQRSVSRKPNDGNLTNGTNNQFDGQLRDEKSCEISNRSKKSRSFSADQGVKRKTRSSVRVAQVFNSSDRECERALPNQSEDREGLKELALKYGEDTKFGISPEEETKLSVLTSTSPTSCTSSEVAASPICVGDDHLKQSKNLVKEIGSLVSHGPEPKSTMKESRKRIEMTNIRVLFSHHLDDDIIKNQKKVLAMLGASLAASISEATHLVTDKFLRTRNVLEAIVFGKLIVTPLWLESCGEANRCIDEKKYILKDAKKEKQFGFSLPASLARECQHPLLKGLKVWITPSTKPGVEILSSLVKTVHGLPLERIGRSVLRDDKIPDDLIVLSCKEDYAACLPFLEKGAAVFSSELLLNGIVTQKLDYERHRLFDEHVKKTRSTIWLKQDSNQYRRVAKCKK